MPNSYFQFKKFRIDQTHSGMKVTTDACLFGAWCATEISKSSSKTGHLLDIGTGTGLLSLMVAQKNNKIAIDAIEINSDAYKESTLNFESSPWSDRIICKNTSLQDYKSKPYDHIICNPPFFEGSQSGNNTNKNQAIHSNSLSQQDLIKSVVKLLQDDGYFYLLYPEREMNSFIELSKSHNLFINNIVTVRNTKQNSVFRSMAIFRKTKGKASGSEIFIRTAKNQYTENFWKLLSPYYLEYNAPNKLVE